MNRIFIDKKNVNGYYSFNKLNFNCDHFSPIKRLKKT